MVYICQILETLASLLMMLIPAACTCIPAHIISWISYVLTQSVSKFHRANSGLNCP